MEQQFVWIQEAVCPQNKPFSVKSALDKVKKRTIYNYKIDLTSKYKICIYNKNTLEKTARFTLTMLGIKYGVN